MTTTFGKNKKVEELTKQVLDIVMDANLTANEIFDVTAELQKYAFHKMVGEDFRALAD